MNAQVEQLRRALAGRYAVEHEIGRGMATVYLGHDIRHGRRVAIKTIDRSQDESLTQRFEREVRLAAQLQHPNIVPLFESGETDGLLYYVMPYVAGASLRERLEREGALPIGDAVRIAREVGEALDHAHRAGVIHRDVKPENIVLADGVAMLTDFGIARDSRDVTDFSTREGVAVGTPYYMSPEQATASPNIDGRSDVYALGCVLYEMLTGSQPFTGANPRIVLARHATDEPPSIQTARKVAPAIEAAVRQAMAKTPADRWATARAFAEALTIAAPSAMYPVPTTSGRAKWVAASAAIVAAAALLFAFVKTRAADATDSSQGVRRVVILPTEFSGDSTQRDFAAGLTDGIINGLIQLPGIAVPDIGQAAGRRAADLVATGRELKAAFVVATRMQAGGGRLRVTARLVNVADGTTQWQHNFDRQLKATLELSDLYAIQDSMAVQIVTTLQPRLAPAFRTRTARAPRSQNRDAYRLYREAVAKSFFEVNATERQRSVALLTEATRLDSSFADAWAELAEYSFGLVTGGTSDWVEKGSQLRSLVATALRLDPNHAKALMLQGRYKWFLDWDWDGALFDTRRAVELAPGSFSTVEQRQWLLNFSGQHDSALALARLSLDTAFALSWQNLGDRYRFSGMQDSAVFALERAADLEPGSAYILHDLAQTYLVSRRRDDADRTFERAVRADPNDYREQLRYAGFTGDTQRLKAVSGKIMATTTEGDLGLRAAARYLNGDLEGAIRTLEAAASRRQPGLFIPIAWMYPRLKGHSGFEAIVRKVYGTRQVVVDPISNLVLNPVTRSPATK